MRRLDMVLLVFAMSAIVAVLTLLVLAVKQAEARGDHRRELAAQCEKRGGVYLETINGDRCVRLEPVE